MKWEFLFYFHVIFLSLAFIIMLISVFFAIRKRNNWLKKHKIGMIISLISMILGICSMAILKIVNNFSHFATPHSQFGLFLLITAIVTVVLGNFMKYKVVRIIHKILGSLVILSGIAVIVGQLLEHLG